MLFRSDLVRAIEDGRVNVSLSDLREYAYSIDALVTYRVVSRYSEKIEDHRRMLATSNAKPWHSHNEGSQKQDSASKWFISRVHA